MSMKSRPKNVLSQCICILALLFGATVIAMRSIQQTAGATMDCDWGATVTLSLSTECMSQAPAEDDTIAPIIGTFRVNYLDKPGLQAILRFYTDHTVDFSSVYTGQRFSWEEKGDTYVVKEGMFRDFQLLFTARYQSQSDASVLRTIETGPRGFRFNAFKLSDDPDYLFDFYQVISLFGEEAFSCMNIGRRPKLMASTTGTFGVKRGYSNTGESKAECEDRCRELETVNYGRHKYLCSPPEV